MANSFSALLGNTPKTSAIIQALPTQSSKPTSLKRTLQKEKRPFKKTGWNYFRVVKARELHAQGVKTSVKSLGEIWSSMSKEEKEVFMIYFWVDWILVRTLFITHNLAPRNTRNLPRRKKKKEKRV